jgi:lysophospholipase L1-like esterase
MKAELNQADGIHPNSRGQEILAERTAKFLLPLLKASARPTQ